MANEQKAMSNKHLLFFVDCSLLIKATERSY